MVTVKISGNVIQVLDATVEKISNLSPLFQQIAAYQERSTKLNFQKESDPDGAGWAGLAPSTIAQKGGNGSILRNSSALIGSISSNASNDSAIVQAGQAYGIFHQTGTSKMPQRKFLGISARDKEQIMQMAERYFNI